MQPSNKSRIWLCSLLAAAALIFLFCRERYLSAHDPANFIIAIKYGYNVAQERPHAPGYPGFYLLWKGIEFVTNLNPHEVVLAANLIFFLCAGMLTYWSAKRLFDERTAILAAALLLTNPVALYFACSTELYVYDAALSAFLVAMLIVPPRRFETALYFLYGLLGAFRLSSVILTFPVVLVVLYIRYRKTKTIQPIVRDLLAVILGGLAWLIPFIYNVGGWQNFRGVFNVATNFSATIAQNISTFLPFHLWMLNILLILFAVNAKKIWSSVRSLNERYIILVMLIGVPCLFFALEYYAKGYALLYLAPIVLIGARLIMQSHRRNIWAISAIAVNLLIFFAVPYKAPSVRSVLNHANRTISERWTSALLRSTSFYSPTYARLRMSDRMMEISQNTLESIPPGSYVFLDRSSAELAYPRALQAKYPQVAFLLLCPYDTTIFQWFYKDSVCNTFKYSRVPLDTKLYYLTTSDFGNEAGPPPGNFILQNNPFALYTEPAQSRDSLMRYLSALFFQK